jgi:protein gp37
MADGSRIEWTEATWNPVTGCSKISPGCKHCYAERLAKRLQAMGMDRYRNGFRVTLQEDVLGLPERWRQPRLVFVNSMSDLFHEDVPAEYISRVFTVMNKCQHHTFQVLTKRSNRLRMLSDALHWSGNIWMGVSVENNDYLHRIEDLRNTASTVKFLSLEPLLGPLETLSLQGIDWVIVGGESGPNARPMQKAWVESIHAKCVRARTPFFFKQWGGVFKAKAGRLLNGKTYNEMPRVWSGGLVDNSMAAD